LSINLFGCDVTNLSPNIGEAYANACVFPRMITNKHDTCDVHERSVMLVWRTLSHIVHGRFPDSLSGFAAAVSVNERP
jgi:hypothetical protein